MTLWGDFENHLRNEGLSTKRIRTLKSRYNAVCRELDLKTATRPDIEKYIHKLNKNEIKKLDGSIPSGDTKQAWKKFLKQFYKWYKGENEYYPKEVSWLKTRIPKDEKAEEKPIIELNEVVKLAQQFKKYEYKILTLALFDSGFRIQEMMSVTKKDLKWEEFDKGKKCFWIRCNESKTFERNIPIPIFTTELKAFFKSSYFRAKSNNDPLFDIHYTSYRNHLKEHSMRLFNKPITPHCLRHSSATYYAKEYSGNVPLLAQRFGWSFSARELQTYVRNSGAYNKEGAKVSFRNEVVKLKEENDDLKEQVEENKKHMTEMQQQMAQMIAKMSSIEKIEEELKKKRGKK